MHEPEKFVYYPIRKPERIQPDCPVFVHSYGLAVQKGSGAAFVQARLVNRCDSPVLSVFLHISGRDISGHSLYELRFVPLVNCDGKPHKDFGEEQVLFLPVGNVYSLDIEVEDVLFADGMIWRRQSGQAFLTAEEAGWITCSCGMKNPAEAEACAYCRKPMKGTDTEASCPDVAFLFQEMKTLTYTEGTFPPGEKQDNAEPVAAPAEDGCTPSIHSAPDVSREAEPPASEERIPQQPPGEVPIQKLFPFTEWTAQYGEDTEEDSTADVSVQESLPETVESSKEAVSDNGPTEAPCGIEPGEELPLPLDMMQETGQILLELQRRIRERETGASMIAPEEQEEALAPPEGGDGREERSRGIGFWALMILLMILLALAGFFGILYWKGYFG